jgi:hypothetical protein
MESIHLLLDELQTTVHSHQCLIFLLLQQHRADELVNVGVVIQGVEFLLDTLILLLL